MGGQFPHIPWFQPEVGAPEAARVAEVLASGYINDGPVARDLERALAAQVGVRFAVAVSSGTAAIALALMACGVGPGDEVVVPDLTFIATANAVRLAGAEVVLVDVTPDRFTIDVARAEAAITGRTRAIVAVDVNGRGADYEALETLCRRHGLSLICDAAEALGSAWKGRPLGSIGRAGCLSFSAAKTVSSGQGGAVLTDDEALHDRLRELKDQGRRHGGTGGDDLHPTMGFNFKYTNLQAAVALAQMGRIGDRLAGFRRRDRGYREILGGCNRLIFPPWDEASGETLQWTDVLVEDRAALIDAFAAANIGCRAFWHPLHRQAPYALRDGDFPNAIAVSQRGLWLPSHFGIDEAQIAHVAAIVRRALRAD